MFKKIVVILGLLLSVITIPAYANKPSCLGPSKHGVAAAICDISFSTVGTFACGIGVPQVGVYTITNNTPVPMQLNYIRIAQNDANPPGSVAITANTCGSSLASGASCSVTVTIFTLGPFNRILQVGVNSRQVELDSPVITPTVNCTVPSAVSASFLGVCPSGLGSTASFGTLAGSTITNTGPTVINGNLGLYPGTSVTGFPPGVVNGTQFIADSTALTAQNDLTTLYNCLAGLVCPPGNLIGTANQAGVTLTSIGIGAVNVFCSGSTININNGVLTLTGDATSVFVFQAGSGLNLSNATILLTGGLTSANVFWQVGSSAVLGPTTIFNGTIAAFSSISLGSGDTVSGRTLARNAAVTYISNTVTLP